MPVALGRLQHGRAAKHQRAVGRPLTAYPRALRRDIGHDVVNHSDGLGRAAQLAQGAGRRVRDGDQPVGEGQVAV
jgi:hypothetical protein